ncbi:hypothetical protein [Chitinimonas lacunae]|uniref:Uncharacterized protein n=1 Tax=Chitinimonas lacunae TaxID=1963018 RepID=A0ABV8MJK2_9NEIS
MFKFITTDLKVNGKMDSDGANKAGYLQATAVLLAVVFAGVGVILGGIAGILAVLR